MKKSLLIVALSVVAIGLVFACKKDKAPILGAEVVVTVKNSLGVLQKATTVYMFKDTRPVNNTLPAAFIPQEDTDHNGIAIFDLKFNELNILESKTQLYFVVYYKIGDVYLTAGSEAILVKRNDKKAVTITIPI